MRFMHIADVHLGASPDKGYLWAKDRGKEIWESFRRCIEEANRKKIDILLIAGDLFHGQPEPQDLKEVNYLFSTLQRTIVVLMAGNHDYIRQDSNYLTFPWNDNVVCLFSSDCERVQLPELKTEIYGFSYHRQEIPNGLYDELQADQNDYFKILLAHGGDSEHIPLNREKLSAAGFDYIALGHIHKPQIYIPNKAMFSGALEPIDCNDFGAHGYVLGEVQKKRVHLKFVKFASRQYRRMKVEINETDTSFSVREKIAAAIRETNAQDIYRIYLVGQRQPEFKPDIQEYLKCGRIIDIEDHTLPAFHIDALRRQYRGQLIGDYIESFGQDPTDPVQKKALIYGLEALLQNCK